MRSRPGALVGTLVGALLTALVLFVALPVQAQLFIDITGEAQGHIDGNATLVGEEDNIRLTGYSHSVLTPYDPSTGNPNGAVVHSPLLITKNQDESTVRLLTAMVSNERLSVQMRLYANIGGTSTNYYTITLTSAYVVSHSEFGGDVASVPPTETFGFTYKDIQWKDELTGEATNDNWAPTTTALDLGPDATRLRSLPNPTDSDTVFRFDLPVSSSAELVVYDTRGRVVRRLFDGFTPIDRMAVSWDGTDDAGGRVARGMYLVKLRWPEGEVTQRVTMLR